MPPQPVRAIDKGTNLPRLVGGNAEVVSIAFKILFAGSSQPSIGSTSGSTRGIICINTIFDTEDVMIGVMAAVGISQAHIDCSKFAAQSSRPVSFQVARVPIEQIASKFSLIPKEYPWSGQQYRVGSLVYQGSGFSYQSRDDRFPAVRDALIDQTMTVCGFGIELPSGYDSAAGKDIQTGQITFASLTSPSKPPKGPSIAGEIDARPVLAKYVLVASWPVYRASKQILLALMKPEGRRLSGNTIIVASGLARGPIPVVVIAKLRGDYQAISTSPNLHGTDIGVGIIGVDKSGTLRNVSFRLAGEVVDALMTQLGSPMQ